MLIARGKYSNSPIETLQLSGQRQAYRAAWSHADPELLPYEGVVDVLRNVVKEFSIIRAGTRGRYRFLLEGWNQIGHIYTHICVQPIRVTTCGRVVWSRPLGKNLSVH